MRKLFDSSIVYIISSLFNSAIPFLLLPILTRVLSEEEYGKIAMFYTTTAALNAFIGLSVHGSAFRKNYDEDSKNIAEFIGSCLQILFFSALIIVGIIWYFNGLLSNFTSLVFQYIILCVSICTFDFILKLRLGQWQAYDAPLKYGATQVCLTIINVSLSLILVVIFKMGADGRIIAVTLASFSMGLFAFTSLFTIGDLKIFSVNKKYIEEALRFGIPLIPHLCGAFLIMSFDRFFINTYLGQGLVAQYMVAVQLGSIIAIIFDAINRAFVPWLFANLKLRNNRINQQMVRYTYLSFALLLFLVPLGFYAGPKMLLLIAGSKYYPASEIIGIIIFGQILGGMYLLVTNYIFYSKKMYYLSIASISCGLFNILLLTYLVPYYGIMGAAFSYCISMLLQFLVTWFFAMLVWKMPWFNFFALFENQK